MYTHLRLDTLAPTPEGARALGPVLTRLFSPFARWEVSTRSLLNTYEKWGIWRMTRYSIFELPASFEERFLSVCTQAESLGDITAQTWQAPADIVRQP